MKTTDLGRLGLLAVLLVAGAPRPADAGWCRKARPRLTWYEAEDANLRGEIATTTGTEGEQKPDKNRNDLGLSLWAPDNAKPGLIYFYWSDSDDPRGKKTQIWNRDLFDTEDVARASKHFLCYKVNASKQDPALLKKCGLDATKVPALVLTSPSGKFICVLPEVKSNVALKEVLEEALAKHFPELWKSYDQTVQELTKLLESARDDYKNKKYESAMEKVVAIIEHQVRTPLIERAEELKDVIQVKLDNMERK